MSDQSTRLANTSAIPPAKKELRDQITAMLPEVQKALASKEVADRFIRHIITTVNTNPNLLKCTPDSFFGSMMMAATLNLMANVANECWLIPYKDNKSGTTVCQFMIGYKGYVKMFYRSALAKGCWHGYITEDIKDNDLLEYATNRRGKFTGGKKVIGYYSAYMLTNGFVDFTPMMIADIDEIRNSSPGKNSPSWKDHYDEMAFKTCYRHMMKYAPLETDFVAAAMMDEKVKNYDKQTMSEPRDIFMAPEIVFDPPANNPPAITQEQPNEPRLDQQMESMLTQVNNAINATPLDDSQMAKFQTARDAAYRNGDITAMEEVLKQIKEV